MESSLDFTSEEEFARVCEYLAMRLHYYNRVAIGESSFAWEVAEMIRRLGRVLETHLNNAETRAEFGDGYQSGTLPPQLHAERLLELLRDTQL